MHLLRRFDKLRYTLILPALISVLIVMVIAVIVASDSRSSEAEQQMLEGSRETAAAIITAQDYVLFNTTDCALDDDELTRSFSEKSAYDVVFIQASAVEESGGLYQQEQESISRFQHDETLSEQYERADGAFVYRVPIRMEAHCLPCHRAYSEGDVAGVYRIASSTSSYDNSAIGLALYDIFFTLFLAMVCIVALWIPLRRQVTRPIERFALATKDITNNALHIRLSASDLGARGELIDLVDSFNQMVADLEESYDAIETKVEQRTEQLSDAMDELTRQRSEVEALNAQLREESAYKSEFLAIISHELKTPLSSMLNNVCVLHSDSSGDEEDEEVFIDIERNGAALLSLINQILDVTRLEAGRATLAEDVVDIVDLLNAIDSTVNPLAASKSIACTTQITDDFPLVITDADKLEKIIRNLMGNAIKFTPIGGHVFLSLSYNHQTHAMLIVVEDDGIGLEGVDTERIFDRFYQSDQSETRKYGGTGIGLSLVKQFAELSEGSARAIGLEKGARFEVDLPAIQFKEGQDEHENPRR